MTRLLEKNKCVECQSLFPLFISLFFVAVLLFASCSKPAGEIGLQIQPEDSKLNVFWTDTAEIYAYSVPDDSVRADELSQTILGSMMDPVFGHTIASVYTQFMVEVNGHDWGPNPQLDSLTLALFYTGDSYGDTTTPQLLHVYHMQEPIFGDSVYYSNNTVEVGDIDYANYEFIPGPNDSVVVDGDTVSPLVWINLSRINPSLGEYILQADTAAMSDINTFNDYFNGLNITFSPVSQGGSLVHYDFLNNRSKMTIYYSNDDADSLQFKFFINLATAFFSNYNHDLGSGTPEFAQQVVDGDTLLGEEKFYAQGLAGVAGTIKIPNIQTWTDLGIIAFNEVKLVLPGYEPEPLYGAPQQLALGQINDDGTFGFLPDELEGDFYFDGEYKSSTNSYTFRITRYIQSLIDDPTKSNNGLYMIVRGSSIFPQRFIFNGNMPVSDTADRMRLEILYTNLDR
jgi:hypothetical protein